MRILVSFFVVWASVLNTSCQSNSVDVRAHLEGTPNQTLETNTPSPGDTQMTSSVPTPVNTGLQNLINQAIADLAQRLSIPAAQIKLVEATAVVWPDSSLGCPQPGMAYTQVPQDGLLIRLQADGQIYEYHSGGRRGPFLCVRSDKQPSPPPQIDILNLTPPNPKSPPGTKAMPESGTSPNENE